jgi:hypothetical protein
VENPKKNVLNQRVQIVEGICGGFKEVREDAVQGYT